MSKVHFLNVKNGDCSIIEHNSGRVSVIDVSNAKERTAAEKILESYLTKISAADSGVMGNFNQRSYPTNPIAYLEDRGINSVFRFIVTHPDMDHLDGIQAFFDRLSPDNFWDTDNNAEKDFDSQYGSFSKGDWDFYKSLRDNKPSTCPKRLTLYSGSTAQYFNSAPEGETIDGLHILAPTRELVRLANECGKYNDSSYVLLYRCSNGKKFVFAGDAEDDTWDHVLQNHGDSVTEVDMLVAPHHGRRSSCSFEYLDTLKPKLTLFGNARSEHLAYDEWSRRELKIITNNQAGNIVLDQRGESFDIYASHAPYAKRRCANSFHHEALNAWYCLTI
jgi:beta-lactamase superfamily II metal-dependent hydrolase